MGNDLKDILIGMLRIMQDFRFLFLILMAWNVVLSIHACMNTGLVAYIIRKINRSEQKKSQ